MIYFIGAGPGDPELITLKGLKILQAADVVIYAGSLVNPELLSFCRPEAEIYNSAHMTLEEIVEVMRAAHRAGKTVARLHTGDPSLYSAVQEQMDALQAEGIPCAVIPGVSSFAAAAAALPRELTLPGVSQTVILTRCEGRTAVPVGEKLSFLAQHRATMCIFLSIHLIERVVEELIAGGYAPTTPVAVVEKVTWPEERIIRGTLTDIAAKVKAAGVRKTALILVGEVLSGSYERSCLYHPSFVHGARLVGSKEGV